MRGLILTTIIGIIMSSSGGLYYSVRTTQQVSTSDSGIAAIEAYQTITSGNYSPQVYTYKNKSYCIWKKRGGAGYSHEMMMFTIDHNNNDSVSNNYSIGIPYEASTDFHIQPAMIVNDSGYIFVAYIKPETANGGKGYIVTLKSNNVEDITSGFTQVDITTGVVYQYPHFYKNSNGLYLTYQNTTGNTYIKIFDRWGQSGTEYLWMSTGTDRFTYTLSPIQKNEDLHVVLNLLYTPNNEDSYPSAYYLKSGDGLTWYSMTDAFTKEISVTPITLTMLNDHFEIINDLPGDTTKINYFYCGAVLNGSPYLIMIDGGCTTGQATSWVDTYQFVYFENNTWKFKDITSYFPNMPYASGWLETSVPDHPWGVIPYNTEKFDLISTIEINGVRKLLRYRTIDKFETLRFIDSIYTDTTTLYNNITRNAIGLDTIAILGTAIDGTGNSNMIISTLCK